MVVQLFDNTGFVGVLDEGPMCKQKIKQKNKILYSMQWG